MSSTLVIYSSKYGATKQYATWIANELQADLKEIHDIKSYELIYYDTVIYGAALYAGKLRDYKKLLELLMQYPPKSLILFAVGLMDPSEKLIEKIKEQNHIEDDLLFYFKGKMNYANLNLLDKFLMKGLKAQLKKAPEIMNEYGNILGVFEAPIDGMNKQFIDPLIQISSMSTLI